MKSYMYERNKVQVLFISFQYTYLCYDIRMSFGAGYTKENWISFFLYIQNWYYSNCSSENVICSMYLKKNKWCFPKTHFCVNYIIQYLSVLFQKQILGQIMNSPYHVTLTTLVLSDVLDHQIFTLHYMCELMTCL